MSGESEFEDWLMEAAGFSLPSPAKDRDGGLGLDALCFECVMRWFEPPRSLSLTHLFTPPVLVCSALV